jgi:carbonic anhydrase
MMLRESGIRFQGRSPAAELRRIVLARAHRRASCDVEYDHRSVKRSARTIDIVYRFDPAHPFRRPVPRTSAEALRRLLRGNDLFVVRVAGNGLDSGCVGSLRYAEDHFSESLRLVVVLGHSQCGAVTAAVDAFLTPKSYLPLASNYPLRAIVDSILVAARTASLALEAAHADGVTARPGYRAALVETTSVLNAALAAYALREELETRTCRVVFGVYDLTTRFVGVPRGSAHRAAPRSPELLPPPHSDGQLRRLAMEVAGSRRVRSLLDPDSGSTSR